MLKFLGGRKMAAFYAALISIIALSLMGKADHTILTAIDSLFLFIVGGNVAAKMKKSKKTEDKSDVSKTQ